ncbi:acidic mammalian chitinase-like [Haliotis rubra]|uniref:acidic mammalian chitinase-like n=1 Tax=Haliotis rubra TaxID=36100 RepID=UPI001EE4FCF3|nr:acidic mammalian chitinase-like [Haliotis rubra]
MKTSGLYTWTVLMILQSLVAGAVSMSSISRQYLPERYQEEGDNSHHHDGAHNSVFSLVCYYSIGQPYQGLLPPNINVSFCSHVIFLGTIIQNSQVTAASEIDVELYFKKVVLLKKMKPSLKVLLSNGGNFSQVLNTQENRTRFAETAVPLLRKYGFDGLDLDWEFPAWNGLPAQQKHNLTLVAQTIRATFEAELDNMASTAFFSQWRSVQSMTCWLQSMRYYKHLSWLENCLREPNESSNKKCVDFVNVMTYDLHFYNKLIPLTGHNSPLFHGDEVLDETVFKNKTFSWAATAWVRGGMRKDQVMTGIPTYAHTFNLLFEEWHDVYALATGVGKIGDFLNYDNVCQLIKNNSTTVVWDDKSKVPYLYQGTLWVSYDNVRSVTLKTQYLLQQGFGGAMVYSLNCDDYKGTCDGKTTWPLFKAITAAIKDFQKDRT